jgi:hypothetical protein
MWAFRDTCAIFVAGALCSVSSFAVAADLELRFPDLDDAPSIVGTAPWLIVRGAAEFRRERPLDLVIAIDRSESSTLPSGFDVDGDGQVGRVRRATGSGWRSTDEGDTVLTAEIRFASELLRRASRPGDRVAVISYASRPRVQAPLGSAQAALTAIEKIRRPRQGEATDLSRAIRLATRLLGDGARDRLLLLLSDGVPTLPRPAVHAERAAVRAGLRAIERGVRLRTVAFGRGSGAFDSELEELGRRSGSRFTRVASPDDLLAQLPAMPRVRLKRVQLRNRTNGKIARAVRVFWDGTFDGIVPVQPGENELEIWAFIDGYGEVHALRRANVASAGGWDALGQLRQDLQIRGLEISLAARAAGGRIGVRSLEIEVEDPVPAAEAAHAHLGDDGR